MSRYLIKINNGAWTIPKENLVMLARIRAIDLHKDFSFITDEEAINFFHSIGAEVSEYNE